MILEREKTFIGCLPYMPRPGMGHTTSVCALTGNPTRKLSVYGKTLRPTELPSQGAACSWITCAFSLAVPPPRMLSSSLNFCPESFHYSIVTQFKCNGFMKFPSISLGGVSCSAPRPIQTSRGQNGSASPISVCVTPRSLGPASRRGTKPS